MRLLRVVYPACASAAGIGELVEGLAMTQYVVFANVRQCSFVVVAINCGSTGTFMPVESALVLCAVLTTAKSS